MSIPAGAILNQIVGNNTTITGSQLVDGIILANIAPVIINKLYDFIYFIVVTFVFALAKALLSLIHRKIVLNQGFYYSNGLSLHFFENGSISIFNSEYRMCIFGNNFEWKNNILFIDTRVCSKPVVNIVFQFPCYIFLILSYSQNNISNSEKRLHFYHHIYSLNIYGWSAALLTYLDKIYNKNIDKMKRYSSNEYMLGNGKNIPIKIINKERKNLYIPADVEKMIFDDVDQFINSGRFYKEKNISFHRGYLLYGPPGTGKSSIIAAIANMYYSYTTIVNIDSLKFETLLELAGAKYSSSAPNIIIFEDFDRTQFCKKFNDEMMDKEAKTSFSINNILDNKTLENIDKTEITFSNFINFLDSSLGHLTPIIYIFTANDVSKIPKVMRRPGRIDVEVLLDFMKKSEIVRMMTNLLDAADFREAAADFRETSAPAEVNTNNLNINAATLRRKKMDITADLLLKKYNGEITPAELQNLCLIHKTLDKLRIFAAETKQKKDQL